ncbi:MAG: hypothetical protein EOP86_26100, partial [Verrucomicrobiaceae bacterium]
MSSFGPARPPATAAAGLMLLMGLAVCGQASAEWLPRAIPSLAPASAPAAAAGQPLHYRAHLKVSPSLVDRPDAKDLWRESMTLALQDIPGPFEVFLNGKLIIKSADVGAEAPKRFKVPPDILRNEVFNTLVIRLTGPAAARGLTHAPVFGGYLDEVRLDREWLVQQGEVSPEDLQPVAARPATAAYAPEDWRPASTVLQAT